MAATAIGRNSGISSTSAASATNSPLPVIRSRKGADSPPLGGDARTAIARMTGTEIRISPPTQLRRRPKISHSSDRKNLAGTGRLTRTGTCCPPGATSAADIEPLPGELDEHLLEVPGEHLEPAHRHVTVHQRSHQGLRHDAVQHPGDQVAHRGDLGEAELGQHPRSAVRVRRAHRAARCGPGAQLRQRRLGDQPAKVHHADVGADLLHLGEQVGGQQHCRPGLGQLQEQGADLAGALRVQAVGRLVQQEQIAGSQQRSCDGQPLPHAEGVVVVPLVGRGPQAHPVERGTDPGGRGPGVHCAVGRVQPAQVVQRGQVRVERGPLDDGPHPGQHLGSLPRLRPAEQGVVPGGRPDQAEQQPDRCGLARAVRAEEPVHRAGGHRQVDGVHRHLAGPEPFGQSARADRKIGHGCATWPCATWSAATSCRRSPSTAPAKRRPSSVSSTENSRVVRRRPDPHEPLTCGIRASSCASEPWLSPPSVSWAGAWVTTTVVQPSPTTATGASPTPDPAAPSDAPAGSCPKPSRTVASAGGVNVKTSASGSVKVTSLKPISRAGRPGWPAANTCSRVGTPCSASIATRTLPIREPGSDGARTSWCTARPAATSFSPVLTVDEPASAARAESRSSVDAPPDGSAPSLLPPTPAPARFAGPRCVTVASALDQSHASAPPITRSDSASTPSSATRTPAGPAQTRRVLSPVSRAAHDPSAAPPRPAGSRGSPRSTRVTTVPERPCGPAPSRSATSAPAPGSGTSPAAPAWTSGPSAMVAATTATRPPGSAQRTIGRIAVMTSS